MPSTVAVTKLFNEAVWERWARESYPVNCAKCGELNMDPENPLEVSHFFNVRKSGTRFEFDNVDPLHRRCHTGHFGWEYQKTGIYLEHMVLKLGQERFNALKALSEQHMSLEEAKATFMEKLKGNRLWE